MARSQRQNNRQPTPDRHPAGYLPCIAADMMQADATARALNLSRSSFFALALEEFLQRYENRQLLDAISGSVRTLFERGTSQRTG